MDVELFVYDLSQGLARQLSVGLLGFQIDAVYHTSVHVNRREFVYDGGISEMDPGSSHHGAPIQVVNLGKTNLPFDAILDYIHGIRDVYSAEAYNLWTHNCNNFSNELAHFLVGKGIPDHILDLPNKVRSSPMGQTLFSLLEDRVNAMREGTSGGGFSIQPPALPVSGSVNGSLSPASHQDGQLDQSPEASVRIASSLAELEKLLSEARRSFAIVFFTSVTCPPCRTLYPIYDELAVEIGEKGMLIKVDVGQAPGIGRAYNISATPTFIAFFHGEQESRWTGARPQDLGAKVGLLVRMASPQHVHQSLHLPTFANLRTKPYIFNKLPPLHKMEQKMGVMGEHAVFQELKYFLEAREKGKAAGVAVPDIYRISEFLRKCLVEVPRNQVFCAADIFRCGLIDPRLCASMARETDHKSAISFLDHVNNDLGEECPWQLLLTTLQMACNLFSSPESVKLVLQPGKLRSAIVQLILAGFLDDRHENVRVCATCLFFNLVLSSRRRHEVEGEDRLPSDLEIELAASVLEAIMQESSSSEALDGMLQGLGHLIYGIPADGDLANLLRTMDATDTVLGKKEKFSELKIIDEVGGELLGKGFREA